MGKVERATNWRVQIDACDTRALRMKLLVMEVTGEAGEVGESI